MERKKTAPPSHYKPEKRPADDDNNERSHRLFDAKRHKRTKQYGSNKTRDPQREKGGGRTRGGKEESSARAPSSLIVAPTPGTTWGALLRTFPT